MSRKFSPMIQHDAHEFLLFMLGQLQDEVNPQSISWQSTDKEKESEDSEIEKEIFLSNIKEAIGLETIKTSKSEDNIK